jgi:type II secretory ATPase GspE/PulE/Tfp pilus assembly ATPase PilB-like protein
MVNQGQKGIIREFGKKRMDRERVGASADRGTGKDLGEMLVEENLITPEQLKSAQELQHTQGGRLSEILIERGLVKAEELATVLSIQLNMPLIDLKRHVVQPDAVNLIPEDMARKYTFIPLDIINGSLVVVMADPEDIRTIEDIKAQAKMRVEVALGIRSDIERAIDLNYGSSTKIKRQVDRFVPATKADESAPLFAARTPVAETLDLLIAQAVKDRASDIHIEPQEDRLRIRYRIDGILHDRFTFPLTTHAQLVSRVKILAEMDIAEQRQSQDGQFSMKVEKREIDIRAATMETPYGERVTLRILDKSLALFTLSELGFQPDILKKYKTLLKSLLGMILVSGPTGSGKTTTLYASINQLDRNELNIMTVEDPIEYRFLDINQSQINPKAGITFASGLRSIMRHDPDVILVGEIRDTDTATTAVQAALTGHLVLSSIHANDAVGAFFRLTDMGVEPSLISSTLTAVVAQRMVRCICHSCRAPYQPSLDEQEAYYEELGQSPTGLQKGTGCNLCVGTGYRGRTGLYELLTPSDEIRKMLRNHASTGDIKEQALKEGMMTMKQDGMLKVKEGITTVSEVLRCVFSIG